MQGLEPFQIRNGFFFWGDGIRAENPFLSFVKSCDMQTK